MLDLLILLTAMLVVLRPRTGVLLVIFLMPFLPRYLGIAIGDDAFALTHRRVLTAALMAGIMLYVIADRHLLLRVSNILSNYRGLLLLVVGLYAGKLVATVLNSGLGLNIFYTVDDAAITLVVPLVLLIYLHSTRDEMLLVQLLVVSLLITELLVVIESIRGAGLLQGVVEVQVAEAGTSALEDRVRDGIYRAKALFDNPLLLTEFVCITWPWAYYLYRTGATRQIQVLGAVATLAAPLAIYLAHTRSGWLVFALGGGALLMLRVWNRSDSLTRVLAACALTVIVAAGLKFAIDIVADPRAFFAASEAAGRSASERLEQFVVVAGAWNESPLLGYGMTRNFGQDFEFLNNIDNYWLRLILEGGIIAVGFFLAIVIYGIKLGSSEGLRAPHLEYRLFMTAAVCCIVSFAAYKMFLSMPVNNVYLFVVLVLMIRRSYWRRRMQQESPLLPDRLSATSHAP